MDYYFVLGNARCACICCTVDVDSVDCSDCSLLCISTSRRFQKFLKTSEVIYFECRSALSRPAVSLERAYPKSKALSVTHVSMGLVFNIKESALRTISLLFAMSDFGKLVTEDSDI